MGKPSVGVWITSSLMHSPSLGQSRCARGLGHEQGVFGQEHISQVSFVLYTTGNACHRIKLVLIYLKNNLLCFYNLDALKCLRSERTGEASFLQINTLPRFQELLFRTQMRKGKEIQPVYPKGDQFWVFIGRTDVEAETPILWTPDAKS